VLPPEYRDEVDRYLKTHDPGINLQDVQRGAPQFLIVCIRAEPLPVPQHDPTDLSATVTTVTPQLSPVEAARRLVSIFAHVRSNEIRGPDANSIQKEPLGMVLDVQISMENARGIPVDIYWQIQGAGSDSRQLNADWVQLTPAYRLNATDDSDGGAFKLWVPLPSEKGDYAISLTAISTADELPNASILTDTFH
jgi:hypothetical protein